MNYVIGDIHANHVELAKLIALIAPASDDTLTFVGDYLDKNPGTTETLALLERLRHTNPCTFIKGNHDYVWERYLLHGERERRDFILHHGGIEALRPFSDDPERLLMSDDVTTMSDMLRGYLELISTMKDYRLIGTYLVLHAGITAAQIDQEPLVVQERNFFLRPADMASGKKYLGRFTVVAGHTHEGVEPLQRPGYINIDLGAGYGKYLGAFCIERNVVIRSDGATFSLRSDP